MKDRNENRAGYKKTKIGWIPEGWNIKPFSKLLNRTRKPVAVDEGEKYREIGIRSHGKGIFHKEQISGSAIGKKSVFWVQPDSLIFNIVFAWELAVAITSEKEKDMIASHRFPMYSGNGYAVDIKFVYWFLMSKRGKHSLGVASPGGAGRNKTLGQGELRTLLIPLPSVTEQKRIAEILYTWDNALKQTRKLFESKKRHKKALMQQLLCGKKRLKGYGHPRSDTDKYPIDWSIVKLRALFIPIKRKNIDISTNVLTASGVHGLISQDDFFNRSVAGQSLQNYYLIEKGEFTYNRSSVKEYPYGAIKRLDNFERGILSTLYICFSLNKKDCDSDFYKHLFDSDILFRELSTIVQVGARNHGLLNISKKDFFDIKIPKPPFKEQSAIARILTLAENEIIAIEKKLSTLETQKRGLMQKLLTGEVRVKP